MFKNKSDQPMCPLMKGPCVEERCRFWVHVRGKNPNTGEDVNQGNCAIAWMPMLMIENSQQQRQTGAAVESFRNEASRNTQVLAHVLNAIPALMLANGQK